MFMIVLFLLLSGSDHLHLVQQGFKHTSLIRDHFMVVGQQRPSRPDVNEVGETWLEPAVAFFSFI